MRIVFFGSSDFAYRSLEELIKNKFDICTIVTQPDRPHGRHLKLEPSKIKLLASKFKISVFQPQDLDTEEAINFLKKQEADLFIVISYGKILTKNIISIPKIFSINLHASLLPKYRGAAPINWALINGEKETG
ncbi:MAG: methionyl-tRNA formyltransferase, partial [Candidatus Omnitrophota bacterium]